MLELVVTITPNRLLLLHSHGLRLNINNLETKYACHQKKVHGTNG